METTLIDAPQADLTQESRQDRILNLPIKQIRPSPENNRLYRPVDPKDPEFIALVKSIRKHGIQSPINVTLDGWIVSGHRRYAAAKRARLSEVPCIVLPFNKDADHDQFMTLLRECNRQREKSFDEKLREEVVSANPEEAYEALVAHRQARSSASFELDGLLLREKKRRAELSKAKQPFLEAVKNVLAERREFWPLSDRQIHYALLNAPPLIHASKSHSAYQNTKGSYKALVDLLTRARLKGLIPMSAIADPTRPVSVWPVHRDAQTFIRGELDNFLRGYWRDLMQSQPNHTEIIGEKNTIQSTIQSVAAKFTIPLTIGRGFCSLPPRVEIAERFRRSGKSELVLLILSDHDPDGEEIAHSFARSLRDDFQIRSIQPVKVALTAAQVKEFHLPAMMQAKQTSTNYKKFAAKHGDDVFELEAVDPHVLQRLLTEAIDAVIDVAAFNHELDREKEDAAELEMTRRRVIQLLGDVQDASEPEGQI